MAIQKPDAGYRDFERDLLTVLRNDKEGLLKFDGRLLFNSRKHQCTLAAVDVHIDGSTGEAVLVGVFRHGQPTFTAAKGFPEQQKYFSVPLRECYEDLCLQGEQSRLESKARKAVIDRYIQQPLNHLHARGLFEGGVMRASGLDSQDMSVADRKVLAFVESLDGRFNFICADSQGRGFKLDVATLSMRQLQQLGGSLERSSVFLSMAETDFVLEKRSRRKGNVSYSESEERMHNAEALVSVYERKYPPRIMHAVAKGMSGTDLFNPDKYSAGQIAAMVSRFKKEGVLGQSVVNADRYTLKM